MKRVIASIICLLSICTLFCTASAAELEEISDFDVIIAGQKCDSADPHLICGREGWYIPLRASVSILGVQEKDFNWNSELKEASFAYEGVLVCLSIGNTCITVGEKEICLQTHPLIYNGITYVPFEFFEKAIDCVVVWDSSDDKVYFQKKSKYEQIYEYLSECVTANPQENTRLEYEYETYAVMSDIENGYVLERQERNGKVKYLFKTGECQEKRIISKLNREFHLENHYRAGKFYVTDIYGKRREKDIAKKNTFINQMLASAHLVKDDRGVYNASLGSESNDFRLGDLEKYALTMDVQREGNAIHIFGSLSNKRMDYSIDTVSGKLLEESIIRTTERNVNGIDVIVESGWKARFHSL